MIRDLEVLLSPKPSPEGLYHVALAAQGTDAEELVAWALNMTRALTAGRESQIREPLGVRDLGKFADGQHWFGAFSRFTFSIAVEKPQ